MRNPITSLHRDAKAMTKRLDKAKYLIASIPKKDATLKELHDYQFNLGRAMSMLSTEHANITVRRGVLFDVIDEKDKEYREVLKLVSAAKKEIKAANKRGLRNPLPWYKRLDLIRRLAKVHGIEIRVDHEDKSVTITQLEPIDDYPKKGQFSAALLADDLITTRWNSWQHKRHWYIFKGKI